MTELEKYKITIEVLKEFFEEGNSLSFFLNWLDIKINNLKKEIYNEIQESKEKA